MIYYQLECKIKNRNVLQKNYVSCWNIFHNFFVLDVKFRFNNYLNLKLQNNFKQLSKHTYL